MLSETSLESGQRPPSQRGITAEPGLPGFTYAVMLSTRMNSSRWPAKTKASPGARRAMNDSSTLPSRLPRMYCTLTDASETIVPMDMRWRRAIAASFTR